MKITLVENWRHLWKAASIQILALGAVLPEVLQLVADNSSLIPWLDDGYKSAIRLVCMVLAILFRPVRQASVNPEPKDAP